MELEDLINQFVGYWKGNLETFLKPEILSNSGSSTMYIRYRLERAVIEIEYVHQMEEEQTGIMILTLKDPLQAIWVDTYHTNSEMMHLDPMIEEEKLIFRGQYGDTENPWGWRIELYVDDGDLKFDHYNLPPEDEEYLGVKGEFSESEEEDSFLTDYEY